MTRPQARRIIARRASLSPSSISDSSQSPPPITLTSPPRLYYPADKDDDDMSLTLPSQDARPATSTSSAHARPPRNHPDHPQPHTPSHYRSHQTHHDQRLPSGPSTDENQAESTAQTSVVLRTTTLAPSSPLLKSTVMSPHASEAAPHHHAQSEHPIQADPKSPYYTFQDTRLIPNPIIRIYMANNANPRMFSIQSISPDTLSLLLSVFISGRTLVQRNN